MVLSKGHFDELLAERPGLEALLREGIQERLRQAESKEPSL